MIDHSGSREAMTSNCSTTLSLRDVQTGPLSLLFFGDHPQAEIEARYRSMILRLM
jgi:hypothetical protein